MAEFIIRLELHRANRDTYLRVHEKLHQRGFNHLLRDQEGRPYQMPPAEYHYEGDLSEAALSQQINDAIAQEVQTFGLLITRSAGYAFYGLEAASADASTRAQMAAQAHTTDFLHFQEEADAGEAVQVHEQDAEKPLFTIRVALHGADKDAYQRVRRDLHNMGLT